MEARAADAFAREWLAAWIGNQPDRLLSFYAPDARYRDPARPEGLSGHAELRPYFEKLLAANPDWVWRVEEIIPTSAGFTLKWRATLPAGARGVEETGLDIVEVDGGGRITRNEVYFDTARWQRARREAEST